MATGRYIAFVDADDVLEENALSILYQAAVLHRRADYVGQPYALRCGEGLRVPVEIEPVVPQPSEIVREIIHMHRIYNNLWNKLYVRELFEDGLRLMKTCASRGRAAQFAAISAREEHRAYSGSNLCLPRTRQFRHGEHGALQRGAPAMLRSMSAILLREGVKELYFRDFLQSCVWVDEKETGIFACMKRFNAHIRPLVLDGVQEERIPQWDLRVYRAVVKGWFPQLYILLRVREKLTKKKWGFGDEGAAV